MAVPVKISMDKQTTTNLLYFLIGVVIVVGVVYAIWKLRTRLAEAKEAKDIALDSLADRKEDEEIADTLGISPGDVSKARLIASNTAKTLKTHKNTPFIAVRWFDYQKDTVNHLNRVKNEEQMELVGAFYTEDMTDNRLLIDDLKKYLTKTYQNKIDYLFAL